MTDPDGESYEFQFTPLREGRRCSTTKSTTATLFQFTPLREGRHRHMP